MFCLQHEIESLMAEVNLVLGDLIVLIRDYDDLVKPRPVNKTLASIGSSLYTKPEPYGLALVVGAWNYPFSLVAQPFVGAIAAG